jgi:hypothetical protein
MAGDWIKVGVDLHEQPEVIGIARRLGLDIDTVVGKLIRVWRWADRVTSDGRILSADCPFIDDLVRCLDFAMAMKEAGWLTIEGGAVSIPNFERHNGKCAKRRALESERKKHIRKTSAIRPETVRTPSGHIADQRREEKSNTPYSPPLAGFAEFYAAFPKRRDKDKARAAWNKLNPDPELRATIMAAVDAWSLADDWTKENGKYVPYPATWLNGRRWNDELPNAIGGVRVIHPKPGDEAYRIAEELAAEAQKAKAQGANHAV